MPKHTPGPWINCNDHIDDSNGVSLFRSTRIADGTINYSDTRLIAAAPELLAALTELLSAYRDSISCPSVDAARAAIAKANGQ